MVLFLVPITILILLTLWVWMICRTLRREEDYLWLILLSFLPPLGVPLYIFNFYVLDDKKNGLTSVKVKWSVGRRIRKLEESLQESDLIGTHEDLAECYFQLENWNEGLRHLAPALDHDPDNLALHYKAAKALLHTDRFVGAIAHLEFIVEEQPRYDTWMAMCLLARVLTDMGDRAQADVWWNKLLQQTTRPEIVYYLAHAWIGTDREQEGISQLRVMVTEYGSDPSKWDSVHRPWIEAARTLLAKHQ